MKRKLFLNVLTILFISISFSQNLTFEDTEFKRFLINEKTVNENSDFQREYIDKNGDGEIQDSEANLITTLYLQIYDAYNINSIEGLEKFSNLKYLHIEFEENIKYDFKKIKKLEKLILKSIENEEFVFEDLTNLVDLQISQADNLLSISIYNLDNLKNLEVSMPIIESIHMSNLNNLETIYLGTNVLNSDNPINLDLTKFINLKEIRIFGKNITHLNISNLKNLTSLTLLHLHILDLNLEGLPKLERLYLSALNSLKELTIDNTLLSLNSVQLRGVRSLNKLNLETPPSITYFAISNSALSELDLSNIKNDISYISINENYSLEFINLKTGYDLGTVDLWLPDFYSFTNNPELKYVCVHEAEEDYISYALYYPRRSHGLSPNFYTGYSYGKTEVNTYCSFYPGGNYNTITGINSFDANSNGCDSGYYISKNIPIKIEDGADSKFFYTNSEGSYEAYVQTGNFTIQPILNYPYFNEIKEELIFDSLGNFKELDFCITGQEVKNLSVSMIPISEARPGFDSEYQIIYENLGTIKASGTIEIEIDNSLQNVINSSPELTFNNNKLFYDFNELEPFDKRVINLKMNTFSPPEVNGGKNIEFKVNIKESNNSDFDLNDNNFVLNQTVVNSFDPNDKTVIEGAEININQKDKYLNYLIRFQNTGTASAINVVVKDELDDNLDWDTFSPLTSSHKFLAKRFNNKIEFIFKDIYLPDNINDKEGSNGFVSFKIKPKQNLNVGDIIEGEAKIYFDFNIPITTNTVKTTLIQEVLSISNNRIDDNIIIYPNPVEDFVYIKNKDLDIIDFSIYSITGTQLIKQKGNINKINIQSLSKGVYFVKIKNNVGLITKKIIKN